MTGKENKMPREIIQSSDAGEAPLAVQVGWSNEQYVQVATVTDQGRSLWWQIIAGVDGTWSPPGEEVDVAVAVAKRLEVLGQLVRRVVEDNAAIDHGKVGRTAMPDADVGRDLLNAFDVTYGAVDGMYVSLDRPGINRLIKLLRRARDAAYGRDE